MYLHLRENFTHTSLMMLYVGLSSSLCTKTFDLHLEKKNQNGYINHDHAVDCININWHFKCTTFIHQMNMQL